jgi:rhodanese-related sulfurtransferase
VKSRKAESTHGLTWLDFSHVEKARIMLSKLLKKLTSLVSVPSIEFGELQRSHRDGACTIVDVRETREFASGHIPGAINLPLSRFDAARIPIDKPIVLICQAGGRSTNALRRTVAAGLQDVRHYPGGMSGWRSRNGAVA